MYLSLVKKLSNQYWEAGKIVPIEFSFPSFQVNEENFKYYVWEAISDTLEVSIEMNIYGDDKKISNLTIDKMLSAEFSLQSNNQKPEDIKINYFIQNQLFDKMLKDNNFSPRKIGRLALEMAITNGIQSSFLELNFLGNFSHLSHQSQEFNDNLYKLTATLEMIKSKLPHIYKKCNFILEDSNFSSISSQIKKIYNEDYKKIEQYILRADSNFFEVPTKTFSYSSF